MEGSRGYSRGQGGLEEEDQWTHSPSEEKGQIMMMMMIIMMTTTTTMMIFFIRRIDDDFLPRRGMFLFRKLSVQVAF